ncbi:hypothetical protein [Promicromonospora xylanilytica]
MVRLHTPEAGDVVLAVAGGALGERDLVPIRDVVSGVARSAPGRPA